MGSLPLVPPEESALLFTSKSIRRRQWHPTPVLLPGKSHGWRSLVHGVTKGWARLSDFTFTFHFHALEKEMATHSSVLAWRIPGTEEPSGLPSMGSHRVRHDWSNLAAAAAAAAANQSQGTFVSSSVKWAGCHLSWGLSCHSVLRLFNCMLLLFTKRTGVRYCLLSLTASYNLKLKF